jgi:tetratricopeptide (TPR) repeat protein
VAAIVASAVLFTGALDETSSPPRLEPEVAAAAVPAGEAEPVARLLEGFSTGNTRGFVDELERRLEANPEDDDTLTLLGLAYQQLGRETGDPAYYSLAGRALGRARPDDTLVLTGRAGLANTRHHFTDALALARRAIQVDPANGSAHGALGDALFNLGRYEESFDELDRAAALAPGVSTYARVAFARELLGRPEDAVDAMHLALEAGSTVPEHAAWAEVQLGNLYFKAGRLESAARAYRRALMLLPSYVYADAGLAHVLAARGRFDVAASRLRAVVDVLPVPEHAILLGDVLTAAGRTAEARKAYGLVDALERIYEANGIRTELETARFDLDHDRRLDDALARARAAFDAAPSIHAEDTLAWALYKNGRCAEAREHSRHALRYGTKDALMLFYRGMIERCLGNEMGGRRFITRAIEINPYFSLIYAPVARDLLRGTA